MSETYSYQTKRYSKRSKNTERMFCYLLVVYAFTIVAAIIIFLNQRVALKATQSQIAQLQQMKTKAFEELEILRTLNPHQVSTSQLITKAVEQKNLYPGWVTRVYEIPSNIDQLYSMMDTGSFVMDETLFTLTSHTQYGINHPTQALYRLNALYPSYLKGRYQIGVEFNLKDTYIKQEMNNASFADCYARIEIDNKRVIDSKMRFIGKNKPKKVVTGEVNLDVGIFPISAIMYCDEKSEIKSEDILISLSFRSPTEFTHTNSRNSVFHIYTSEQHPKT